MTDVEKMERRLRTVYRHGSAFPGQLTLHALGRIHGSLTFEEFLEALDVVATWDELEDEEGTTMLHLNQRLVDAVRLFDGVIPAMPTRDPEHPDLPNPTRVRAKRTRNGLARLIRGDVLKRFGIPLEVK